MTLRSEKPFVAWLWQNVLSPVLTVVLVLVDPRVFFRAFVGSGAEVAGALATAVFATGSIVMLLQSARRERVLGLWILAFGVASIVRFVVGGVSWTYAVQMLPPYLGGAVAVTYSADRNLTSKLLTTMAIAMCLHAIAAVAPPAFLSAALDVETASGELKQRVVGTDVSRATGITSAPGYLSLYSVIGLALAPSLLGTNSVLAMILLSTSLVCGAATGNRSFVVGVLIVAWFHGWLGLLSRRGFRYFGIAAIVSIAVGVYYWQHTSYEMGLAPRFSEGVLDKDIDVRLSSSVGILGGVEAFLIDPVFGTVGSGLTSGAVGAWNGRDYAMPHNAIVWVFATRGTLAGMMYIGAFVGALRRLWSTYKFRLQEGKGVNALAHGGFLVALVGGLVVCMTDPVGETGWILLVIGFGLGSNPQRGDTSQCSELKSLDRPFGAGTHSGPVPQGHTMGCVRSSLFVRAHSMWRPAISRLSMIEDATSMHIKGDRKESVGKLLAKLWNSRVMRSSKVDFASVWRERLKGHCIQ